MANELAERDKFSTSLTQALEENEKALPADFNMTRFVQNSVALLNGNDTLKDFIKKNPDTGLAQIKAGLLRGAYLGLDALNSECYLVPYGSTLNFMPSYKGSIKLCMKYSTRPIKSIYAKVVRECDKVEFGIDNNGQYVHFTENPFVKDSPVVGAFAVCEYKDGALIYDAMSKDEIEQSRKQSKAKGFSPWQTFWGEMAKKTVLHRLCKHIPLDLDAEGKQALDEGLEIETDPKEISKNLVEQNGNKEEFVPSEVD